MKYAAKIKAEPGWKAVLCRDDETEVFVEIKEFGLHWLGGVANMIPIDTSTNEDIRLRRNFLRMIDPNDAEG
jgi:hypothetical protein